MAVNFEPSAKSLGGSTGQRENTLRHGRWRFFTLREALIVAQIAARICWMLFVIVGLGMLLWLLLSGCALNMGSGSASTDASEIRSLTGTNRTSDVKIGK